MNAAYNRNRMWPLLMFVLLMLGLLATWEVARYAREQERDRPQERPAPQSQPTPLGTDEERTIGIFRRVSPSVVSVANRALVRDPFGFQVYEVPRGAGSGFVWDKQGHIVSNFHVVYQASALRVTLPDGTTFDATVVGLDPDHDIAVLKIDARPDRLVPILPGTSRSLQVGQRVMAIGNPFGLDTSLSEGIVSALGRSIDSMTGRCIYDVIQTDAAINPGNSGGPLLDSAGRLIGINTAIVSPSGAYSGVGFAVPVDTVKRVVPALIAFGEVRRAGLGVQLVPDHLVREDNLHGAAILRVPPDGAAARAGLQGVRQSPSGALLLGDIIVAVDRQKVDNNDDLLAILDRHEEGETVELTCVRRRRSRTVPIVLQAID